MAEADTPLRFTEVSKGFARGRARVQALDRLEIALQAGTVTGLLGPDGAGKTTLMRLATGLLLPDTGTVTVLGADTRSQANTIQREIGYMPQRFGLYEDLTVQENLDLYADLQGLGREDARARQQDLLKLTALGPFGARRSGALSGGMKQKLGLACALLRAPQLLLLDEPTVGVDPIARRELWDIVQGLRDKGVTVLMSTAYFDEAERCDEIILLHQGRLLKKDTPKAFGAPLQGRCLLVTNNHATSKRHLREALQARLGVQDARILAEGVRVLCRTTAQPAAAEGEQWQPVDPVFEDAFVDLLGVPVTATAASAATTAPATGTAPQASASAPPGQESAVETVIEVRDLCKFFGHFEAVKGNTFRVQKGQIFGLLGANGAGKTTTFRMLCGLLPASSGTLRVAGVDMRHASGRARARIGYVSQKFALYGNLSCDQNLAFFSAAYGLRGTQRQDRLNWARQEFQLRDYRDVNADDLPLGIKQRLALACALLHEPPILFLDEPTSGVDPLARREFWQRVNALAESGVTVMITTHFMDEAEYCDNLVLMSLGEVLAQGSPEQVRAQAKDAEHPDPSMEDAFILLIQAHESRIRRAS
ncbi:ABC transporter ATP-binding protein [Acidithiobacillus sp. 'AMD consortium']|uniref:ABC transporter ATP-binding protein n=2 Tax=Acidithiobacillus ferridurans TaxID=1232575 RepID=A0A8X8G6M0_ACIFI|nr:MULTISPECIES: ATP-binding cassette domain-containing protein [Acidithiobacillus]MBU2716188.1 ABC transporter ATP-binding protein [Acidithiobacillus ferridurans]MBU2722639.1 ABC transporter ATP-binding protein [Acidithiobacillus ferridurans]MBU2728001.1 ABC transporter ATP-binding protein [Acidithiobacillus ferridurans]QFG79501.1 ABC transporter ATP-binding protein [Acidithiobacillus sp. 'AMD consortium']BBF64595.1 putative ABC transporter ATP-binding protein YbhF [Acidithiobacillus ferridur